LTSYRVRNGTQEIDDPNEAHEVMPIEPGPHGPPVGWWTVKRNGLAVRHFPGKEKAERFATDPGKQSEPSRRKSVGEGEGEIVALGSQF
jgi:hypothetical protein